MQHQKVITATISSLFLGNFLAVANIQAAQYTTAALNTERYQIRRLSWILTGPDHDFTLSYQESNEEWQTITDTDCQNHEEKLSCQTNLPVFTSKSVRLRLTFADDATLQTFNLNLDTPSITSDTPLTDQQIFYSNFKNLSGDELVNQLTWQEFNLSEPAFDQIIVQTRASFDGVHWSDWQGNSQVVTILTDGEASPNAVVSTDHQASAASQVSPLAVDFTFDPNHITIQNWPEATYEYVLVEHLENQHSYRATGPIASGDDEKEAFGATTFYLSDVNNLQLGETLVIRETVNDIDYQLQGIISDLKPSENLVSVFAWEGAIPYRLTSQCDGHNFCFSPAADVQKIATNIYSKKEVNINQPIINIDLNSTVTPQTTKIYFLQPTTAHCLEYQDDTTATEESICKTKALSLENHYQNNQKPLSLQYRLIYGLHGDKTVSNVLLHHQVSSQTNSAIPTGNRLRGGKKIEAGSNRVIYWR